jgi:colanic acid/amylovoran biosynthesis protein
MNLQKPIKILIINVHSTMNAGDAALLWLNIRQLEKVFPNANFTALVNYPNEPYFKSIGNIEVVPSPYALVNAGSKLPGWQKIFKLGFGCILMLLGKVLPRKLLEKNNSIWLKLTLIYRSVDVVAAVSGVQLLSLGRFSWPLIVSSISIIFTHYYHKPLYIMPQSLGPFRWKWERWLVREIYSRARLVILRDAISIDLSKEIGLPESKIKFAFDPGFALPGATPERAMEIMSGYGYISGQHSIGMTVIARLSKAFDRERFDHYYRTLANLMGRFISEFDVNVYIFDQVKGPTREEDDSIAAELLRDMFGGNRNRIIHIDGSLSPMELKACYGLMDMFVATRFHSGVFAMSSGVATLFIGYNPKTKGFLEAVGLNQLGLDINNLESNQLWELLISTWENRQTIAEKTQAIVINCQKDYDRVSKWISEDYFDASKS